MTLTPDVVDVTTKVPARWYHRGRTRPIRLVLIHTTETGNDREHPAPARNVARYFATTDRKASSHLVADDAEVIRCVDDQDTAWAAPGANAAGLQLEVCGFAAWRGVQADRLWNAAKVTAQWCHAYGIPVRRLTKEQLLNGERGIIGHVAATEAWHQSTHTDPGKFFPWPTFLQLVNAELDKITGHIPGQHPTHPPAPAPHPPPHALPKLPSGGVRIGSRGAYVTALQRLLKVTNRTRMPYGPRTRSAVKKFQGAHGIKRTGVVGEVTDRELRRVFGIR